MIDSFLNMFRFLQRRRSLQGRRLKCFWMKKKLEMCEGDTAELNTKHGQKEGNDPSTPKTTFVSSLSL